MNEVVATVVLLAAVMLVIEVVGIVTHLIMNRESAFPPMNPVILINSGDDALSRLEDAERQLRWNTDLHIGRVIVVCDEEDSEIYESCLAFCNENRGFELCQSDELKKILCRMQKNEGK